MDTSFKNIDWINNNVLNISTEKTVLYNFSKSRRQNQNNVILGGISVPEKTTVKYLGLQLDKKLLWKDHIKYLIKRTENGLNIIRAFNHQEWGSDPNIVLLFYKAYVLSILDYSSIFYGSAAKTCILS